MNCSVVKAPVEESNKSPTKVETGVSLGGEDPLVAPIACESPITLDIAIVLEHLLHFSDRLSEKSMIACQVLIAPMIKVIASTYWENLLALVSSHVVKPPTNSDVMDPISHKYLSVTCTRSYNCPGNFLYCSNTLMLSWIELMSLSAFVLKLKKPFIDHAIPLHLPIVVALSVAISSNT